MNAGLKAKILLAFVLVVLLIYVLIVQMLPVRYVTLISRSAAESTKESRLKEIKADIWHKIASLQEHGDCEKKKILFCDTQSNFAGLGSMLHRYGVCAQIAFGLGRLFIIHQEEYDHFGGLSRWLLPDSERCGYLKTKTFSQHDICHFSNKDCYKNVFEIDNSYKVLYYRPKPQFPTARRVPGTIPAKLEAALRKLNVTDPKLWFSCQFLGYLLLRPNEYFLKRYRKFFKKSRLTYPFVSMHIRHGDKLLREAKYIKEENFVRAAEDFFSKHPSYPRKQIYIASDDQNISNIIKSIVPHTYMISMLPQKYKLKTFHPYRNNTHFPKQIIESMLIDLYFLLYSNYTICTYTSNIGRLVNLLKRTVFPYRAEGTIVPVDDEGIFGYKWYGGWYQTRMSRFYVSMTENKADQSSNGIPLLTYKKDKLFKTTHKKKMSKQSRKKLKKLQKAAGTDFIYVQDTETGDRGFIYKKDMNRWPGNPSYYLYPE